MTSESLRTNSKYLSTSCQCIPHHKSTINILILDIAEYNHQVEQSPRQVRIEIRGLEKAHRVDEFDCGDEALNVYLRRFAWKNQAKLSVGATYIAYEIAQPRIVLGYYTLASASVVREQLPSDLTEQLPRYPSLPAALLARLAVDRRFHRAGIGKVLLRHAIQSVLTLSKLVGCRYLIVDAYPTAAPWYAKYGFVAITGGAPGSTQPMLIDLRTVEHALP